MFEIKLKDIDALQDLLSEFGVITYLQSLVQYDLTHNIIVEHDLEFSRECAEYYLWTEQLETLIKLKQVIEKEDFACKVASSAHETSTSNIMRVKSLKGNRLKVECGKSQ